MSDYHFQTLEESIHTGQQLTIREFNKMILKAMVHETVKRKLDYKKCMVIGCSKC